MGPKNKKHTYTIQSYCHKQDYCNITKQYEKYSFSLAIFEFSNLTDRR